MKPKTRGIDADRVGARQFRWHDRRRSRAIPTSRGRSWETAPTNASSRCFRQQLPGDAETARAQRRADGHLLLTVRSSRQQQVGHVDARTISSTQTTAPKRTRSASRTSWTISSLAGTIRAPTLALVRGNCSRSPEAICPRLRLGLFERDAGLQTADDVEQSRASILREILELLTSERRPHVDGFGQNRKTEIAAA